MASTNSTFRPTHDNEDLAEHEREREDDVAPGRRALTRYLSSSHGDGHALPTNVAESLGPRIGDTLEDVRVYDDARASQMVKSVGAAGLTYGRKIYLADHANDDTLAHEAAHAAQHRGPAPTGPIQFGGSDHSEDFADRAAAARYVPGMQVNVPTAAPRVRFRTENLSSAEIIQHIATAMGKDKAKAASMLRKADAKGRAQVEAAVRQNFSADEAKDLIEKNPSGGSATPKVSGADAAQGQTSGKNEGGKPDQKKGPTPKPKGKGGGPDVKPGGAGGDQHKAAPAEKDPDFAGMSDEGLGLIQQELTEHEKWKGELAKAKEETHVGDANSADRAAFIADNAGKGVITGAATGVVTTVVGKGLEFGLTKIVGKEIPGIGPLLAGGMSAYALATKNWKESGAKIASFGQGADGYEKIANSLASIGEVLDIAINILNVFAGLLVVAAGIMWLVTILTVGVATPLAAACTSLAAGIIAVTTILDMINRGLIQPLILVFRAMHTFTSEADPRDVAAEGDGLSEAASDAASFFAAKATEGAMKMAGGSKKAGGDEIDLDAPKNEGGGPKSEAHGEPPKGEAPKGEAPKGEAPKAEGEAPKGENEGPKNEGKGENEKPKGENEKPKDEHGDEHEKTKEEKKAEKEAAKAEEEAKQAEREKQAKEKIDAAEQAKKDIETKREDNAKEREDLKEHSDEKIEAAKEKAAEEAKVKADAEAKAKHAATEEKLNEKLREIDEKAQGDEKKLNDKHAEMKEAAKTAAAEERATADAEADAKRNADVEAAQGRAEKAKAANAEKAAKMAAGEPKGLAEEGKKIDAAHEAAKKELSGIEDEKMRADALESENKRYAEAKSELEAKSDAAKKAASDQAKDLQQKLDAAADEKLKAQTEIADAKAEKAKARAQIAEAKKLAAADTAAAKESAAHDEAVKKEQAAAKENATKENAATDKAAADEVKKAGDHAASHESEEIKKERKKLNDEANKLAHEDTEAEEAILKAKNDAAAEKAYKLTHADKWANRKEEGAKAIDLSIIKNPIEKAAIKPGLEKAGVVTKGEEKKEEPKPGEPTTLLGKTGKVFTDTASVFSPSADKKRYDDFKEGFKEGPKKARVMLPDPPGTLEQLNALKAKIDKDLKARGVYAKHETANAATEEEQKANAAKLKDAAAANKGVQDASKDHGGKVDAKDAAIGKQDASNKDAGRTLAEKGQRMAGITAVTIPLGIITGLAHIVAPIWGGAATFARDGDKLLAQFASITKTINESKANSETSGKKIDDDKKTNAATKTKAGATDKSLADQQTNVKAMDTKVTTNAADAGKEKAKAASGKSQADASAKKGEGEYKALLGQLTAWATNHKNLRMSQQKEGGEGKHE